MIAASIAIFLAGMIALQPAGMAKARSAAEDDKGPVFCFAMQRAPKSPAEKTGLRHCGSDQGFSRAWPRFALSRSRVIAPMEEAMAIRTPVRSTNSAKLRVLDEQYRGGDHGYEARAMAAPPAALARKRARRRRARMQRGTASSPPLDDPFRPPVSLIPLTKATSYWSGAPAELRSAALLFRARRLACSPPSGGVFYGPACCLTQSTTRAAPDAGARKKPGVSRRPAFSCLHYSVARSNPAPAPREERSPACGR